MKRRWVLPVPFRLRSRLVLRMRSMMLILIWLLLLQRHQFWWTTVAVFVCLLSLQLSLFVPSRSLLSRIRLLDLDLIR